MKPFHFKLALVAALLGLFAVAKVSAADLSALESKLGWLTEAVANAEKAGDAEKLATLAMQWRDLSPMMTRDLGKFFDESAARMAADVKNYRAKADDGDLPEKTAQIYRQLATRTQESLKNLMVLKGQMSTMSDKLDKTLKGIADRPDVKPLIEANEAQKKAAEALQSADNALDKLSKLQR